uniref:Protein O-glucosyltransferase 2 n=1 Tax=Sinocyclocheilus grahami TaxID=75366 RepID=A0A672KQR2_SINGR
MSCNTLFLFCTSFKLIKTFPAHDALHHFRDAEIKGTSKPLIRGPGLETNTVLPARFFFIQTVDTTGRHFTTSPGEKTFEVKFTSPTDPYARIWVQMLDRNDGSFLVRYRMYKFSRINGALWEKNMHCPTSFSQTESELSVFPSVDPDHSLCHYTIKNNQVYIKTHGEHVGFRIFMDAFLLSLIRKVKLPDIEFFVNLEDWPLEKRQASEKPSPIFSWCGSNDTQDIVMPTYDLTESVLETMGRVSLDMMSVQGHTGPAWEQKISKAFWRGRDSRKERLELVKLARANPDMLDAALTNNLFFKHDESLYGPLVKHVSFFDFFKILNSINSHIFSAALPDSVVFKHDSIYYEHFYMQLQPWVHYIPFKADLSDLLEKIQWARDHDEEVHYLHSFSCEHKIFASYNTQVKDIIPACQKKQTESLSWKKDYPLMSVFC